LRRLVNRSISSTNAPLASNFIRTPYPSLDEDTAEARTPPVTNGCMLNGNRGGGETAEDGHDGTLTMNTVNEADFRCIAVEINEERFGLSSSSSPKSITSNC
ncbi:unnamed protein product, partial [Trichobilharzia regenti]